MHHVMQNDTRYTRDPALVTRHVAGETLIVPVRSQVGDLESIFTLNEWATFIWERLDGRPVDAIVRELCTEYAVDAPEAEADTHEFLNTLAEAGLVRGEVH